MGRCTSAIGFSNRPLKEYSMPLLSSVIVTLAVGLTTVPQSAGLSAGTRLTYSGTLRPADGADDTTAVRAFRIHFIVSELTPTGAGSLAWVLEEGNGGPRWSWPQRFGSVQFNRSLQPTSDRELPAIQAERDGMVRVIPIKLPIWPEAERLKAETRWDSNDHRFEVITRESVSGRRSVKVGVSNRLGPREVIWVDEQAPLVTRHRELVFLGQ